MVDGGAAADRECLDDVCALVKEGGFLLRHVSLR